LKDIADGVEDDADCEGLQTTEYICDFAKGGFDDGWRM
jgi:hypothetical protein